MSEIKHMKFIVYGEVQGVGFRYFTHQLADELGLIGWVKNHDDGTVEIRVEGKKSQLLEFRKKIEKGNHFSKITHLEEDELYYLGDYRHFEIRYF